MKTRRDKSPLPLGVILDRLLAKATGKRAPTFRAMVKAANLDRSRDFVGALLRDMDFRDEDLRGFNFSNADLTGADFRRANIEGVSFHGAELRGAIGLRISRRRALPKPQRRWERPATIGFLGATKHSSWVELVSAFERRLRELGWLDGHNLEIDYHWADARPARYKQIAQVFSRRGVDVIVTASAEVVRAAKDATDSIPIVFAAANDPVGAGLVRTLKHPGGNITGVSAAQDSLASKRLRLLRKVLPGLQVLAILGNSDSVDVRVEMDTVTRSAMRLGIITTRVYILRKDDIPSSINKLKGEVQAIYVCSDPFVTHHLTVINISATRAGLPTMHASQHEIKFGGLISYGPDFRDMFSQAADYVDKILRGAKPADLPVKQEMKNELVINMTTARALGLAVPIGILQHKIVR